MVILLLKVPTMTAADTTFVVSFMNLEKIRLVLSVPSSLVITCCWERADILALLCVMFPCVFVTFPYGVLIPDLCLLCF